jgi:putative SOS response-associated peptidase YedK
MCGKFTTKLSWTELVDYVWRESEGGDNDRTLSLRVMDEIPVIVWDGGDRRILPMRWGFPHHDDWRRPQPIHARGETVDTVKAFAQPFRDGQRGIVMMQTFNEAPDIKGPTIQHTITPDHPVGVAFVWRRFDIAGRAPLLAACMVTVAANPLIASLPTDRMPAVLAPEDWAIWLGEDEASPERTKQCLKTVEGMRWTMAKEERAQKAPRRKPTVSDPAGLF